jgi:hypothetical protein
MSMTEVNTQLVVEELSNSFADDNAEIFLDKINDLVNEMLPDYMDEFMVQNNLDDENEDLIEEIQYEAASRMMQAVALRLKETWR